VRLGLIDYGAGNLPSVKRAFQRLGAETVPVRTPEESAAVDALVLPGVGHFAALARTLEQQGLFSALREAVAAGKPFLGICLGLQALYASSEEAPGLPGMGIFPGVVRALPSSVKLPHMGWNQMRPLGPSRVLAGIPSDAWFYFAHSYAAPADAAGTVATVTHGREFAAAAESGNIFAVQFHPEKSGEAGAAVLRNFLEASR
jgi:imidazole glycerol phosphate synthase glutamine amidotransferase subunit